MPTPDPELTDEYGRPRCVQPVASGIQCAGLHGHAGPHYPPVVPNLPPLPGQEANSQEHGMAIIRAAIDVAIANQARHVVANLYPLDLDRLVAASAILELAITALTQACVDAQVASQARWS